MSDPMIDATWCRAHYACYGDRRLASLFDRPLGVPEVLTRRDGPWKRVPARDRMGVFFRAAPVPLQMIVANRAADRQVRAHCLHCGAPTVEAWACRWLSGEDRSVATAWLATEAVQGGWRACSDPARNWLWSAATEATWAAWWTGARVAARAAGFAAAAALKESKKARRAEHLAQLADAIEVLAGDDAAKEQP